MSAFYVCVLCIFTKQTNAQIMTNIANKERLTIIEGILSMAELEPSSKKVRFEYYECNEYFLEAEIDFENCKEKYVLQDEFGDPLELTTEEKELIYSTLYDAYQTHLNNEEIGYWEEDPYPSHGELYNKFY